MRLPCENTRAAAERIPRQDGASVTIGRHLLADFGGIAPRLLANEDALVALVVEAVSEAGCHVLSHISHRFAGPESGVTGLVLLSESHAAFHTYPEHQYLALDVFVCGNVDPLSVLTQLQTRLGAEQVTHRTINRELP